MIYIVEMAFDGFTMISIHILGALLVLGMFTVYQICIVELRVHIMNSR